MNRNQGVTAKALIGVRGTTDFDNEDEDFYSLVLDLSDREMQEALKGVPNLDLVRALIDTPAEVTERVMQNLSPRARVLLSEDVALVAKAGVWDTADGQVKVDASLNAVRVSRIRFSRILTDVTKTRAK